MRQTWIVVLVLAAAAVGGAAGSGVTLLLRNDDDTLVRGTLVHLGPPDYLARFSPQPFCVPLHHFCIARAETGKPIALYTYDPHPSFREQGCEVVWYAERDYTNQDGSITQGTFIDPCGGSVYDSNGRRLFGPTPRDMDSFPVSVVDSETIVDTRSLVCGELRLVETGECPRAPLGD